MIKPTIGRQVLVYRGSRSESDQFEPASICYVHSDELINVGGFTMNGVPFSMTSIKLVQDPIADNPSTVGLGSEPFACWMSYQRAQAEKPSNPTLPQTLDTPGTSPTQNSGRGASGSGDPADSSRR